MAKVNFTAGRIDAFRCEDGKSQSFLWDAIAPGLGLRATATGAKAYIFQCKLNGQAIRITLGSPATWTIDQAQIEARRLKVIIDNGKDPRQVKLDADAADLAVREAGQRASAAQLKREAAEKTKRELVARVAWDAYLAHPRPSSEKKKWGAQHRADHAIAASAGGSRSKIGDQIRKPAPLAALLAMPIHSITAEVVQSWLMKECETRPTFAHNAFRKFRAFIRWCSTQPAYAEIVHIDCCLADAVKDITPSNKTKEGDCLQREQLLQWFTAVRNIANPVISAYLQALQITGARRGELEIVRWNDVDFK